MPIIKDSRVCFGMPYKFDPSQVKGIPESARVRFRFRPGEFPRVFVKTSDRISVHLLEREGDGYKVGLVQGENVKAL